MAQEPELVIAVDRGGEGARRPMLRRLAEQTHEHPVRGPVRLGRGTIEDWLYLYRREGLVRAEVLMATRPAAPRAAIRACGTGATVSRDRANWPRLACALGRGGVDSGFPLVRTDGCPGGSGLPVRLHGRRAG